MQLFQTLLASSSHYALRNFPLYSLQQANDPRKLYTLNRDDRSTTEKYGRSKVKNRIGTVLRSKKDASKVSSSRYQV